MIVFPSGAYFDILLTLYPPVNYTGVCIFQDCLQRPTRES